MILDTHSVAANGSRSTGGDRAPTATVELVSGLSSREKARRLVTANRASDVGQRTLAFYLHEMHTSGDYKDFACASARQFATDKLELARTTAIRLLQAGDELTRLRRTDAAFCEGDLRWSKVCLVCEAATPETEEQWLAYAKTATVRELQREVAATRKGQAPRGNRRGLPRLSYLVEGRTDEIGHEVWETARQKLSDDTGEPVSNAEMLTTLAEAYLRNGLGLDLEARVPTSAPGDGDEGDGGDKRTSDDGGLGIGGSADKGWGEGGGGKEARKRLGDSLFCLVAERCPTCKETVLHKEDGPVILSRAKAEMVAEDARVHELAVCDGSAADAASRGVSDGSAAGAASQTARDGGSKAPGETDIPTPSWMRRMVLLRDGNRCLCCRRRYLLMAHHVLFRSQGGETHPSNLASLCSTCHEMVHEEKLTVEGDADSGFRFFDGDGEPVGKPLQDRAAVRVKIPELTGAATHRAALAPEPTGKGDVVSQGVTGVQRWTVVSDGSAADAAASPGSAADAAAPRPGTRSLSFASLPPSIDTVELMRIAPCLVWNERRRSFEWREGSLFLLEPVALETSAIDTALLDDVRRRQHRASGSASDPFSSLIGLERATTCLRIAAEAARIQDRAMPDVLLSGPPGVGKTAVARALAAVVGSRTHTIQGPMLRDPGVLATWLTRTRRHDLLFIDEIHAVPRGLCELLYEVLDRGRLTVLVSRGTVTKTLEIRLEPLTIVGATTHLAEIPEAFRSRFPIQRTIDFYEVATLERIVEARAAGMAVAIDSAARHEVARVARGIPRRAIAILGHASDVATVAGRSAIEASDVRTALREHDIDPMGLEPVDRKVLSILEKARRPVALGRLAARAGLPIATLRDVVEPFLLRAGLIDVTARGRVAVG